MKVKYDKEADAMYIAFNENEISGSEQNETGIILDYDKSGSIVGIEILCASQKIQNPTEVEYEVA